MGRLMKLASDALDLGVVLISDAIDSWSSGESRAALLQRLRENAQRAGELALENESLKDEVDGLRFNGPTLYRDEVELLKEYATRLQTYIRFNEGFDNIADAGRDLQIIQHLLDRCDHMPMSSDEFAKMADDAINGRIKTFNWDDVGKDIDDE